MRREELQEDEDREDGDDGEEKEVVDDGLGESERVLGGHTYMTSTLRRKEGGCPRCNGSIDRTMTGGIKKYESYVDVI